MKLTLEKFNNLLLLAFATALIFSCKKENNSEEINFHYDYFPMEIGRYVVYEAMEINHDIQGVVARDTNRFYLKTVIGDTTIDNSGKIAFKLLRYKKEFLLDEWDLSDVWTTRFDSDRLEFVEENNRIVKLIFPTIESKVWNVNAFNTAPRLLANYNVEQLHAGKTLSGFVLDSTIQVEIQDFFSLVDHRRKYEVYAKGVGLVQLSYKDNDIMNFDTLDIRYGREKHYKMIDFGKE
jgi:hypothetical protein